MSVQSPTQTHPAIRWLRSIGAVLAGLVAVVVLSIGMDAILEAVHVLPPPNKPLWDPGLNVLALSYRLVAAIVGGWVTARLAATAPRGHALALAILGFIPGLLGVIIPWSMELGPHWYPIALAALSPPAIMLGGWLAARRS